MTNDQTPGPHDDDVERDAAGRAPEPHEDAAAATAEQAGAEQVRAEQARAEQAAAERRGGADDRSGAADTSTRATTQPTEVQPATPAAHTPGDGPAPATGAGPRLVPWTHRPTTSGSTSESAAASSGGTGAAGAAGAAAAAGPAGAAASADTDTEDDEPGRGRVRPAVVLAVVGGAAVVAVVLGTVLAFTGGSPLASGAPSTTSEPASTTSTSARPTGTPTPTATPTPTVAPSETPRAATPPPQEAVEAPYVTSVAAGTVVAEADVRSPKGSIAFHYRVVAVGDGTFSTEWSGYTSTLPVTVQLSYFEIAPAVFDGLTSPGDGVAVLGGPTTAPTSGSASLPIGQPSYLGTLVVSTAEAPADVPVEISTGKVLAVAPVRWAVPPKSTNIAPADSGVATFAEGTVTATTPSGAPKRYLVAPGDLTDVVAQRFGISVAALIYLNQGLQVLDAEQHLYEGTTLLLDPDSL
ncbi:LysM peptidoglycan-binding domain-containing protein [Frigoribacterium sp. ACAM 257]|uniref:LysM peptidoglycan-binding domain-containing protein n=1 Tax=Frigoribacterium sp. ACAM 257 TaxID=2508998 RepID=UPI0011B9E631|nr:LysM peptidoglycan-binding domain-containing protein [Frigoribacterium sp. ACAM 257]TWX38767.1 LysM peptidoglycan-binding domain-containing protein [Frigoribacterium sp. ACAM 257]